MELNDLKEKVSGAACEYLADLLERKLLKFTDVVRLASFFHTGVEGAGEEAELRKLGEDVKILFPDLPEFSPGI